MLITAANALKASRDAWKRSVVLPDAVLHDVADDLPGNSC